MLKGLIFDFDGTLVNTERLIYETVQKYLFEEYGCSYSKEIYQRSIGASDELFFENIEKIVGCKIDKQDLDKVINKAQKKNYRLLPLRPAAKELIDLAKQRDKKIAIVTNSNRTEIDYYLNAQPKIKRIFDKIITIEDVKYGKPNPEGYLKCLSALGFLSNEVIVIEDSPVGVEAALAANLTTITYPNEFTQSMNFSNQSKLSTNLTEVIDILID